MIVEIAVQSLFAALRVVRGQPAKGATRVDLQSIESRIAAEDAEAQARADAIIERYAQTAPAPATLNEVAPAAAVKPRSTFGMRR